MMIAACVKWSLLTPGRDARCRDSFSSSSAFHLSESHTCQSLHMHNRHQHCCTLCKSHVCLLRGGISLSNYNKPVIWKHWYTHNAGRKMVAAIPKERERGCVCAFTSRISICAYVESCSISVCFTFRRRTWSTNSSRYWCHATSLYLLQSPPSIAFPAPTLEVATHWGYWSWKVGISALRCLTVTPALDVAICWGC